MDLRRHYETCKKFALRWETWDNLRMLIASRLLQGTIAIPIIGYMILFNAGLEEYLRLYIDPGTSLNSWRLILLYFGFSSLAVSAVIFNFRCPPEVRHHGAAYDFVDKQERIMKRGRIKNMYAILVDVGLRQKMNRPIGNEDYADIMTDYFELLEEIRPRARRAVLSFYLAGLALLAVPTGHTFYLVVRTVVAAIVQ